MSDIHKTGASNSEGSKNIGLVIGIFVLGFFAGYIISIMTSNRNVPKPVEAVTHLPKEEVKMECPPAISDSIGQGTGINRTDVDGDSEQPHTELVITKAQRERMLSLDFLSLLHDAEIQKYRHEGETRGIRLTKIRSGSIFDRAGFKNGDVIVQINGLAVADLGKKLDSVKEDLPKASKITLKVRRDDKIISIRIRVAGN